MIGTWHGGEVRLSLKTKIHLEMLHVAERLGSRGTDTYQK